MADDGKGERYAYLNRLSTKQLMELLHTDFESPEGGKEEMIFQILGVIEKREEENPTGLIPDEDEAWSEFQQYYAIPEGENCSLYPTEAEEPGRGSRKTVRLYPRLKVVGLAAAIVAVIFGMMITAQAFGLDVFGAIGRWTDETFQFTSNSGEAAQFDSGMAGKTENGSYYNSILSGVEECKIRNDIVPTWFPEGATMEKLEIVKDEIADSVTAYFTIGEEEYFFVDIMRCGALSADSFIFEKDDTPVEQHLVGTKMFYIMSNLDTMTATWSDGTVIVSVVGNIPVEKIKTILDSIEEV